MYIFICVLAFVLLMAWAVWHLWVLSYIRSNEGYQEGICYEGNQEGRCYQPKACPPIKGSQEEKPPKFR